MPVIMVRAQRWPATRASASSASSVPMLITMYEVPLCRSTRLVYSSLSVMVCTTIKPPMKSKIRTSVLRCGPSAQLRYDAQRIAPPHMIPAIPNASKTCGGLMIFTSRP